MSLKPSSSPIETTSTEKQRSWIQLRGRLSSFSNSPRRVLFPFVGDTVGGSHISAIELVGGLDPARFKPIVTVHQEGTLQSYLESRGIAFERAPNLDLDPFSGNQARDAAAALRTVPRLVRLLRRLRIDIVHTHDARMHFLWGPAAKLSRARFVLHLRNIVQSRISFSSRFADSILAVSEYCRSHYSPGIAARIHVVPNPFRPPCSKEGRGPCRHRLLDEAGGSPQTKAIVGYVSNFVHRKRPVLFVETAARLRDRFGDDIFFPMFGETGGTRDKTVRRRVNAKIAEYGLTSCCVLMGPRFPIEPWMMGFDVLVAPAVNEPYGRTLIEAMLCGTPVVAADDGGNKEIICNRNTGLLVDADDAAAFARAVAKLLHTPQMAKAIATAAETWARATHSVETHVERIQSIYDSLPR